MVVEVQGMLGTPVAFVVYVLTRLEDHQGWVTKSTTCAECPESAARGEFTGRSRTVNPVT